VSEETDLIEQARQGDQIAFGELVTQYQSRVYNLAYRMLGNPGEAEEAAQEAFIRAYTHLDRYDPNRSFKTWLLSITSHYCIDLLRKRRLLFLPLEEEIATPMQMGKRPPRPDAVVMQHDLEREIQEKLDKLSPTDRAAVVLLYWYDCSYKEIAQMLGLTVSAVKSRLHRSRRALAKMLTPRPQPEAKHIAEIREEVTYAVR
jgi:RNA polymerase sigma-70 factor (ECF subfamily)